uniref:DUF2283 domain-containing protein n=1 Tax=Candidatus Kentrum sp. FM TaxID=2126340 RepID=A0A450RVK3_9GAMM|nr:MAG: Protein of unknown function (DUF2283) [Candidatus Kentron sp. FM]VFJ73004.1 MAG: Protein of unknown function (DUF2283) [Candidatus Kentron sp. FM]VFK15703.1 MAG: Protein of unknown function (DUF2283) [Candidatus Kentron sp. FM]
MKIAYYEEDDTLFIEFSKEKIVRDESIDWDINIGYTNSGIGEITILDASRNGCYPWVVENHAIPPQRVHAPA